MSRSIATRLSENEVASLNLKLQKDGFESVGDLIRHYISDFLTLNDSNIENLATRVSEIVSLKLASGTSVGLNNMNTPDFILDQARSDVGLWCSLVSIPPLGGGGLRSES
jgi:hypothetical protein